MNDLYINKRHLFCTNYQLKSIIGFFVVLTCVFPYITFYSFGTDIQPWCIIFLCMYFIIIILSGYKFKSVLSLLFIPILFSISLIPFETNYFNVIRSVSGYIVIGVSPVVFLYILRSNFSLVENLIKFSILIYFLVATYQFIFNRYFLVEMLNRISTLSNRGVTSLTPEPTSYGLLCLFMLLILTTLDIKNKIFYSSLLICQILLFSQSSMVILLGIIFMFMYLLASISLYKVVLLMFLSFLFFAGLLYLNLLDINVRIFSIFIDLYHNPFDLITIDESINDRVSAIYFSIKGFFDNYLIPNGFSSYQNYVISELPNQTVFYNSTSKVIMSYYGGILFQLGFVGMLIPVTYSFFIIKYYKANIKQCIVYFCFINFVLLLAIPMTFPLVGLYIACLVFKTTRIKQYPVVPIKSSM